MTNPSMATEVPLHELFVAYHALHQERTRVTSTVLDNLTEPELGALFRRRAFELHPDRATLQGISPAQATATFRRIAHAYEVLRTYLAERATRVAHEDTAPRNTAGSSGVATESAAAFANAERDEDSAHTPLHGRARRLYSGQLPERPLMLGQFLYYAGVVSWREIVEAIVSQRRETRQRCELPGQPSMNRHRIGHYFVMQGLLGWRDLALRVRQQREHNARMAL